MTRQKRLLALVIALSVYSTNASAQVFGTFNWQMQPYCNQVTMTLTSVTGNFTLDGTDDQCGGPKKASASGVGVFNPDGTVGLNFTIVTSPAAQPVAVSAVVSPANGQGTWTDNVGNSGTFAFFGSTPGLPPRPLPSSGIAAAVITNVEIANNAITGAKVEDGSLTTADLLDGPRAAFAFAGTSPTALSTTAAVVRSVTLTAPSAGTVIATASGFFTFGNPTVVENGRCYLETGTTVNPSNQLVNAEEPSGVPNSMFRVPFGATRGISVSAGPVTINLLCDAFYAAGSVVLYSPSLTAFFIAQ